MNDNPRNIGKVKFFSALKGYGFLIPHKYDPEIDDYVPKENAGQVFVHFSHILSNHRFKTLQIGELVEYYDIEVFHHNKTPKGPAARAVTGIGGCEIIGDANAEALFQQYGPCCYSEFPENGYQYPIYFPQGYHP